MFSKTDSTLSSLWHNETLQALKDFIAIPSLSPSFDASWEKHGYLRCAIEQGKRFAEKLFSNIHVEVLEEAGKSPLLFFELPPFGEAASKGDILFYGHLDKQPPAKGWSAGRAAFTPTVEENVLYGRGAADDGYSFYAALSIAKALEAGGVSHPRLFGVFETGEESGSPDFDYWMQLLASRLKSVALVLVLDAGCLDYKRLCITTNFRGVLSATLKVSVLRHGVHSGTASGIVPDSFMIARNLLDRLEDSATGKVLDKAFYGEIPAARLKEVKEKASLIGSLENDFPWIENPVLRSKNTEETLLAQTWLPELAVIGAAGLPDAATAGNVLRESTSLRLSMRLPPTVNSAVAQKALQELLLSNPPFGAMVELLDFSSFDGWDAPEETPALACEIQRASKEVFGLPAVYSGEGGSLSIFDTLEKTCPTAQFLLTGVLGPHSNAHGPDEALHLDYVENLCKALARIVARLS